MYKVYERNRGRGKTSPSDCHQCRAADEAFGFDLREREDWKPDASFAEDADAPSLGAYAEHEAEEEVGETREARRRRPAGGRMPCAAEDNRDGMDAEQAALDVEFDKDNELDEDEFKDEDAEDDDAEEDDSVAEFDEDDELDEDEFEDEDADDDDVEEDESWVAEFDEDDELDEDEFEDEDADDDDVEEDESWVAEFDENDELDEDECEDEDENEVLDGEDGDIRYGDLDEPYSFSDNFDWREPRWKARRHRSGDRIPFTPEEKKDIRDALAVAHRWARRAKSVFEGIWIKSGMPIQRWKKRRAAWRSWPDIVKWFGSGVLTRRQIRVTRRRVQKIERILRQRRISFVKIQHQTGKRSYGCSGKVNARAFAGYGAPRKIFICPIFYTGFLRSGSESFRSHDLAKVIIHELVHEIGFRHQRLKGQRRVGVAGGATSSSQALQLVRENPRRARRNPANFEGLYASQFFGKHS